VDPKWFGTRTLEYAADILTQTAIQEGAVGLAAQQCGINARIVYVQTTSKLTTTSKQIYKHQHQNTRKHNDGIILVNPLIVARSPEAEMIVWREECLVLPPTFRATVLRDSWVDVRYRTVDGESKQMRLQGEQARCVQHELDHDRGILITDHVSLEEMENDQMRNIEANGHDQRMMAAYDRYISEPDDGLDDMV
jgi:peptide deformylase